MAPKRKATTETSTPPIKRMRPNITRMQPAVINKGPGNSNISNIVDLTGSATPEPPISTLESPCRFLELPAEIRLSIYRLVLPHDSNVIFRRAWAGRGMITEAGVMRNFSCITPWSMVAKQRFQKSLTSLFLTNKMISNEAKAVLYGENNFVFNIDSMSHRPKSFKSPQIFGPFGTEERLPLLRNMRTITIVIKSLLKRLQVYYEPDEYPPYSRDSKALCMSHMYSLESFAQLRGIEEVEVKGTHLPDWFAKCLQLVLQGTGGDVLPLDYPEIEVKRRVSKGHGKTKRFEMVMQTTKQWYEASLNWEEFAVRNGIQNSSNEVIDLTEDKPSNPFNIETDEDL